MVTVTNYKIRSKEDGTTFIALIVQGGVEMVRSKTTGKLYATSKTASVPSTFSENEVQAFIGQQIPGKVAKVPCESYEYVIKDSGEVISLDFRYEYVEEQVDAVLRAEAFTSEAIKADVDSLSLNGVH